MTCALLLAAQLGVSPSAAAPAGFRAAAEASGPLHRTSLTVQLEAGTADVGSTGNLYVVASLPNGGGLLAWGPAGWSTVGAGTAQPWQTVTLGTHTIPVLDRVDLSAAVGAEIYAGYGNSLSDVLSRGSYAKLYTAGADLSGAGAAGVYLSFSINVQDFAYPELSAATVGRIVDLHEQYRLPVDIYLSDTLLDRYRSDYPALLNEARAGEVIRTLSPLGVEFDVHAHSAADRARCAERIRALGGAPSNVASGLINTEIDGLRQPQGSTGATAWQARTLWGLVTGVGHGDDSDDTAAGLWRPRSGTDWRAHDPAGNLVAVGNGGRTLAAAEALATQLAGGTHVQPLYSATLNVAPQSLQVVGTSDGITQIETWAARVGALPPVRWNIIAGTAAAFEAAGSLPSRVNPAASTVAVPTATQAAACASAGSAGSSGSPCR